MNLDEAKQLVKMYVDGWKANDFNLILKPLAPDCVIIESHGPTYHGISDVRDWVQNWIKDNYKVGKWNISSFYFVENTAIFEWQFAFSSQEFSIREIDGISIAKFNASKISSLREYRTTKPLYDWGKDKRLNTY